MHYTFFSVHFLLFAAFLQITQRGAGGFMQNVLKHAFERSTRWADFWPGYGHANFAAKTEPKVKIVQDNSLIISIQYHYLA